MGLQGLAVVISVGGANSAAGGICLTFGWWRGKLIEQPIAKLGVD